MLVANYFDHVRIKKIGGIANRMTGGRDRRIGIVAQGISYRFEQRRLDQRFERRPGCFAYAYPDDDAWC